MAYCEVLRQPGYGFSPTALALNRSLFHRDHRTAEIHPLFVARILSMGPSFVTCRHLSISSSVLVFAWTIDSLPLACTVSATKLDRILTSHLGQNCGRQRPGGVRYI